MPEKNTFSISVTNARGNLSFFHPKGEPVHLALKLAVDKVVGVGIIDTEKFSSFLHKQLTASANPTTTPVLVPRERPSTPAPQTEMPGLFPELMTPEKIKKIKTGEPGLIAEYPKGITRSSSPRF